MIKKRQWPVFNQRHSCLLCNRNFHAFLVGVILGGLLLLVTTP